MAIEQGFKNHRTSKPLPSLLLLLSLTCSPSSFLFTTSSTCVHTIKPYFCSGMSLAGKWRGIWASHTVCSVAKAFKEAVRFSEKHWGDGGFVLICCSNRSCPLFFTFPSFRGVRMFSASSSSTLLKISSQQEHVSNNQQVYTFTLSLANPNSKASSK